MDLLPYTKIGGWAHGHASNSRFYWKPDLYEMGRRMAELEQDVSDGKPDAKTRLKTFRVERILLVDSIIQGSIAFEEWAELEAVAQSQESENRRNQRQEALINYILDAGYEEADINHIGLHRIPTANLDKVLTEDAWRRIKRKVESTLSCARENRLLKERRQREDGNKTKAEVHYSDALRQVLPIQRLYLPALYQASELSCFRDLIDPDREAQPADWEDAAAQLPQSLSEWMGEHKEHHVSLLPSQSAETNAMEIALLSSPSIDRWRDEVMPSFAGQLDLATSVFRHSGTGMLLIGRDACHAWKLEGQKLEYCARGAEAVHGLLATLQLDPASTTASMLDQLGKQFLCVCCPEDEAKHPSWRSCVVHFVDESTHELPLWEVLSTDKTITLTRERSMAIPRYPFQSVSWLCNHCSNYLAPPTPFRFGCLVFSGNKKSAIQHVKTEHNIENPVEDLDLFLYPISGNGVPFQSI